MAANRRFRGLKILKREFRECFSFDFVGSRFRLLHFDRHYSPDFWANEKLHKLSA